MEPVDFTETKKPVGRYTLSDGSVIEIILTVGGISRAGNDPSTGFPIYVTQTGTIVRLVSFDTKLRQRPKPPEGMVR